MAQNQSKVLLVDADMRRPRLHEAFKQKNNAGLSNFLSGQSKFEEVIKKTEIENLSLVCGGPYPPNPSELLSCHKMKEFIQEAGKSDFDFILFDMPPMMVVTDAVILSKSVDGTIIVLESGKTSKRVLPRVDKILKNAQARVVGAILNRNPITSDNYQYYNYYYGKTE